ncbi:alpha/beta fold hydrolase [Lutibaculum baratangense]|uniref:Hydrolase n=1 Tax=Lutibaculum baratangense AMV1 TaxID=631454 RepID=V4TGZ1_9HYPH|nr:alpha/beta hydrolase [Lutibaculum baratangense]ESR25353.1 Hydrolase [Lutibaculum baratangense AMV1]
MILDALHCPAPAEVVVIEAQAAGPAEAAIDALLAPLQPLREQFVAITGFGLEDEEAETSRAVRRAADGADGGTSLSYLAAGNPRGQRIVFIHGSPGVAEEWGRFLVSVPRDRYHLAVDRPGFGQSLPEEPVVELGRQARAIAPLLRADDAPKAVLVGYSYGGPVALRLAADYPDRIGGVLLIGSAGDPTEEEVHPLQELAAIEMFAGLLPLELANSNTELVALKGELETLAGSLGAIEVPVTIVQGLQDTLVPPENAVYLQRQLRATSVRVVLVEDGDHFLPWTHADLLRSALDCVVSDSRAEGPPASPPPGRPAGAPRSD